MFVSLGSVCIITSQILGNTEMNKASLRKFKGPCGRKTTMRT